MQIRTFTVPIHDDGGGAEELNRFLRSRRVLEVEREFVQAPGVALSARSKRRYRAKLAEAYAMLNCDLWDQNEFAAHVQALVVFTEYADAIDMAILDVMMPMLGGRDVMERIHAKRPEIRFLFSSGYSENAIHTNFVIMEGLRLITKPYRRADLLRAVRDTLDSPQPGV